MATDGSQIRCFLRSLKAFLLSLCLLSLTACEGMRLYDKSKDEIAASAKTQFVEAEVTATVDVALRNYDALLEESVAIAAREAAVRKERAYLDMALTVPDPDATVTTRSIATWFETVRTKQLKELGFADMAKVFNYLDKSIELDGLRKTARADRGSVLSHGSDPQLEELLAQPLCEGINKDSKLVKPVRWKDSKWALVSAAFDSYKGRCLKIAEKFVEIEKLTKGNAIQNLEAERDMAFERRDKALGEAIAARRELDEARTSLGEARKMAGTDAFDLEDFRAKAKDAQEAAEKLLGLSAAAGLEAEPLDHIKNLALLLGATATGQIDSDAVKENEALGKAAVAAAELPSLFDDALAILTEGKAPPVNHLILALNHQQILVARAETLGALWEQEIALFAGKVMAIRARAKQILELQYHLCNYATFKAGIAHQGLACLTLVLEQGGQICKIGPNPRDKTNSVLEINDCALSESWAAVFPSESDKKAKKELLEAVVAYSRALDAQAELRAFDFRIIDLGHRRIAADNRASVAAWTNLIAVPTDTLAAYYQAGIQPDTLANAASQILGLFGLGLGIGIGASD